MKEKRKFPRLVKFINVEAKKNKQTYRGLLVDISRSGIRVNFKDFPFKEKEEIELKIQRPHKDIFIPALGVVQWIKKEGNSYIAGIHIKDFPSAPKGEILEEAYKEWLKTKLKTHQ